MEPLRVQNSGASSRLSWSIRNAGSEAEIDIFDTIGDPWDGTTAKDFVQQLRGISANKVRLNINSPGGFVDDALAMYDAILEHPAEVTAHITVAASAASFVAMAADKRVISKNGKVQIHDARAFVAVMSVLNVADLDDLTTSLAQVRSLLEEESENIASIYAERAGGTAEDWREAMKANGPHGTVYRGQAAVDAGLVHEVAEASRNAEPMRAVASSTIVSSLPDPEPKPEPVPASAPIDLSLIPSLANGYKPPLPADFTRLVAANLPAKGGPANGNGD